MLAQKRKPTKKFYVTTRRGVYTLYLATEFAEEKKTYYSTTEAAEKLGLSDQTIRRMCDKVKFKGAYKTEGGHWRIPENTFITSPSKTKKPKKSSGGLMQKTKRRGKSMHLIYDAPRPPKVFIDTTVLCGAIRVDGVNRKILQASRLSDLFEPVFSKVCLFEFVRTATNGLGKGDNTMKMTSEDFWIFF